MTQTPYTLRKAIGDHRNLAYIADLTETISPLGRRSLLNSEWLTSKKELEREYDHTEELMQLMENDSTAFDSLCRELMCLRDITTTLSALKASQAMGDIELYELKALALVMTEVRRLCLDSCLTAVSLPDVEPVVKLLDPEGTRVAHFYIYDAYSPKLKELRQKLKTAQKENSDTAVLFAACSDEETRIRSELSASLQLFAVALMQGMETLGRLDMLIARGRLEKKLNLVRPSITSGTTRYKGLRNPQIAEVLEKSGRQFQPVDIEIAEGVTVITGANMAGKSVVLKTVALCQLMAQFGYHVPAEDASVSPVEEVLSSIGDAQDELEGLSSYAAEMLRINNIIRKKRSGVRCLALIDEPARTTNPEEGKALVNAIIELLGGEGNATLLTTHYSGLRAPCRRLRVHGFREEKAAGHVLSATTGNDYIDYRLEPDDDSRAPHEALRIARLIGVDAIVADTAAHYLDQ